MWMFDNAVVPDIRTPLPGPNGAELLARDKLYVSPSYTPMYPNLPSIGAEVHLPFGGLKKSGNGHPSAAALVEAVKHKTAWTVNHGTDIKMAQGLTTAIDGGPA
ncbi:hypothetical protein R5W24_002571 [Gemmata sp. JC717]|nr:hypothetical protein [Gemmata algarum]MDY3553469.1 hypothetical protein [Gemmata algarum]